MALGYVPLMVLAAIAVVACLRLVSAAIDVNSAAAAAARQASIARTPATAVAGGNDAAAATLDRRSITCQPSTVTVDTAAMRPGGQVAVTIACTVHLEDLYGLGLPGAITITGTARQPVDTYRSQP
jgi:multisubunit Na+/H+ antiporter MnhE subunit